MAHRAHLFSLRLFQAAHETFLSSNYNKAKLVKDLLAGITVGIIAIPLSMALAIASGVAPQYGLYTAIIAGFVIALTGGSRLSISGPTAAFVVILYPIAQQYGLGGLLLAGMMSGVILILMGYLRLGRFVEYIPEPVTLGFTGGIAIVIATFQIKDFFGLNITEMPEHYAEKAVLLFSMLPETHLPSFAVAMTTLFIMLLWPKLKTAIPPHLPAVVVASIVAVYLNDHGFVVDTIGSRFHYLSADGSQGSGIPPYLPHFEWPWLRSEVGSSATAFNLSWTMIRDLLPSAFAIAMLSAIESLLCAVVLDGMTGKRHSANSELVGQGIGNIITPLFGGITATAAIARSAVNFKAGGNSPLAAMFHALVVLLALYTLAPLLAYLPMPSMAALLMIVAWNMSEAHKSIHLVKEAPRGDIWVFVTCILLTVLFDMVIAITTGILLAAVLFMKEIADRTKLTDITESERLEPYQLSQGWRVYKINGPLFFAAADKIFSELVILQQDLEGIILYLDGVPLLDAGGLAGMNKLIKQCQLDHTKVIFADFQFQPLRTLARAKVQPIKGVSLYSATLDQAIKSVTEKR